MSKILNEYKSTLSKILNEYKSCVPMLKCAGWFALALVVWLTIPSIAMQVSLSELNTGKFISVVVFFVTAVVWGIIASPVIRRLASLSDKAFAKYSQKDNIK